MNILITGASGFIGQALAKALLSDPSISHLTMTDLTAPPIPSPSSHSTTTISIRSVATDLTSPITCAELFTPDLTHVYLLHGLMSSATEANVDLGLRVNFDSTRTILDILCAFKPKPSASGNGNGSGSGSGSKNGTLIKVIYASACAVYGPPLPPPPPTPPSGANINAPPTSQPVTETTLPLPHSSYGAQKLLCETLLTDYTRCGLLQGLILRLPTIIVRPGLPTGAASSFVSSIVREPLAGRKAYLPVGRGMEVWVCSARAVIGNLVLARDVLLGEGIGGGNGGLRVVVNLPGRTVTVEEILVALKGVGGEEAVGLVEERGDEAVRRIVGSWPTRFDTKWARELGFVEDGPLERAVWEYVEDYGHVA